MSNISKARGGTNHPPVGSRLSAASNAISAGNAMSNPKMAVYGEHRYNNLSTGGGPEAGTRSRMQMLRQQHRAASGKNPTYTTSSLHLPSSDKKADGPLPFAGVKGGAAGGGGGNNTPRSADPNAAAAEYAAYVNNLREQVGVLETEVSMYKAREAGSGGAAGKVPAATPLPKLATGTKRPPGGGGGGVASVETHNTNLMEQLQRQNQTSAEQVHHTKKQLAEKNAEEHDLRQELHRLRAIAAAERNAASSATRDKEEAIEQKRKAELESNKTEDNLGSLQKRFDFVLEELNFVKNELDVARAANERRFDPPSSQRVTNQEVAQQNESLKNELEEMKEWLRQRDTIIDQQQEASKASQKEHETVLNSLRHEQQRYQLLAASHESTKVRLADAESEAEYLRCTNAGLQEDVKRLTRQADELFSKIKTEMESHQIKDSQMTNAMESSKALQHESAKVNSALLAEQAINRQLRDELSSMKMQLDDSNRRNASMKEKYEQLQDSLANVQTKYNQRTAELEDHMGRWKQMQARQLSSERQQLELTQHLIVGMKSDADCIQKEAELAAVTSTSPTAAAAQQPVTSPSVAAVAAADVNKSGSYVVLPPPQPSAIPSSVMKELVASSAEHPTSVTSTLLRPNTATFAQQRPQCSPAEDIVQQQRQRSPEVADMEREVRLAMKTEAQSRKEADDVRALAMKALAAVAADNVPPPPPPLPK